MLKKYKEPVQKQHLPTVLGEDAGRLIQQLQHHTQMIFPPHAKKTIRNFSPAEAAYFIGISDNYLRKFAQELDLPVGANGKRSFSIPEMNSIRSMLQQKNTDVDYIRHRRDDEGLQVISLVNFKGGSAKTTTSAHLAQYLALRGYRTLAIDLDPQASLTTLFGMTPETEVNKDDTLYSAIRYEDVRPISELIWETYIPGLDLIPANLELAEFEHDTPKALINHNLQTKFYSRISEALSSIEQHYDVVIIDSAPQLGFLTMSALCASTSILITVHPEMLDVLSMSQFLLMMRDLMSVIDQAGGKAEYDWIKYLMTRYEPNDMPQYQMSSFMRSIFGKRVLENAMLKSTAISDAGVTKKTLYEVERSDFTRSTYDRAMESLNSVNGEVEALIREVWGRA